MGRQTLAQKRAACKRWYIKNREYRRKYSKTYYAANKEWASVYRHHYCIFVSKDKKNSSYKGMKFFKGWNPNEGGSFRVAAKWIIENLGRKPKNSTLNIINHERGFVPGNLEWTSPREQAANQMFKIIARLKKRIKGLEQEIAILRKPHANRENTFPGY